MNFHVSFPIKCFMTDITNIRLVASMNKLQMTLQIGFLSKTFATYITGETDLTLIPRQPSIATLITGHSV